MKQKRKIFQNLQMSKGVWLKNNYVDYQYFIKMYVKNI